MLYTLHMTWQQADGSISEGIECKKILLIAKPLGIAIRHE